MSRGLVFQECFATSLCYRMLKNRLVYRHSIEVSCKYPVVCLDQESTAILGAFTAISKDELLRFNGAYKVGPISSQLKEFKKYHSQEIPIFNLFFLFHLLASLSHQIFQLLFTSIHHLKTINHSKSTQRCG